MEILALPIIGLLFAAFVWGFVRMVHEVKVAEDIGRQMRVFTLIVLLAVAVALVGPLVILHGRKIYGWSLFFDLTLGWLAVGVLFGVCFQIAYVSTKREVFRVAVSAVLVASGVLLFSWFTVMTYLLALFGIVMTS